MTSGEDHFVADFNDGPQFGTGKFVRVAPDHAIA